MATGNPLSAAMGDEEEEKPPTPPANTAALSAAMAPTPSAQPDQQAWQQTGALTPSQVAARASSAQQQGNWAANAAESESLLKRQQEELNRSGAPPAFIAALNDQASKPALNDAAFSAGAALQGVQNSQINNQTGSDANFAFNDQQTANRQDADNAVSQAKAYRQKIVDAANGGVPDPIALIKADQMIAAAQGKQGTADLNAQSTQGGVQRTSQKGVMPGLGGLLGLQEDQDNFSAGPVSTSAVSNTNDRISALADSIGARPVAQTTAAQIDKTAANQARDASMGTRERQEKLASMLEESAAGRGPSVANAQLQQGTDRNLAQALALASSGHGNAGMRMRQAANARADASQTSALQSAQVKAQEQQSAQQALGAALGTQRGQDLTTQAQDIGAATSQADIDQKTNIANLQATLDSQKESDAMRTQLLAQLQTGQITQAQMESKMAQFNAELLAKQEAARNGQNFEAGNQQTQAVGQIVGGIASAVAS